MTKKNIRIAKRWAFPIAATAVAVLYVIQGNYPAALWALMAAAFHLAARFFEETCDDLLQANHDNAQTFDEIITAYHDIAEALKKEQAKNAELQEEIIKLKQ